MVATALTAHDFEGRKRRNLEDWRQEGAFPDPLSKALPLPKLRMEDRGRELSERDSAEPQIGGFLEPGNEHAGTSFRRARSAAPIP